MTSWTSVTIAITEYWVLVNEKPVRDFVCLRERDTASGICYCGLESLLYEKLFFHCRHPIALPLVNLYPRYSASILQTRLQRNKKLRLVHLPLVLSARKPWQRSLKRTETSQNLQTKLLNVLSTGGNIGKKLAFLCFVGWVRFARHCGKMYSRHLFFSFGGLKQMSSVRETGD